MKRKPRVYFSFRSPYSWMALTVLERRLGDLDSSLELVPYWDPDAAMREALERRGGSIHYVQMSKAKHLYLLQDVKRLTAQFGLPMAWPVDIDPWWEVPHLGWLAARRQGKARAFYDAVARARWHRGDNICDAQVIAQAAAEAGLDAERVVGAADDPELRQEALECLSLASDDSIFGVPYFRLKRHRFWGLDRVDGFIAALAQDGAAVASDVASALELPSAVRERGQAYDTDTAGGCG